MDATAYVMRRRSTFGNPITLSTRVSNAGLSTSATSMAGKTIEVPLEANNNNKRLSASSYRESVC
jgi:hypothetical protein